jgi:hypothetical protein
MEGENMTGKFFGRLRLTYLNGREWPIENPPGEDQFGYDIPGVGRIVPHDKFITDFASIPRFFWRILPPVGDGARARYGVAAVIHDWLYTVGRVGNARITRLFADEVFGAAMESVGVSQWRINLMVWAVKTFGAQPWTHVNAIHEDPTAVDDTNRPEWDILRGITR